MVPGVVHRPIGTSVSAAVATGSALALAAYSWWATGLHPTTTIAYVAVGIPTVALATAAVVAGGSSTGDEPPPRLTAAAVAPWLVLAASIVAVQALALALGGRSHTVPTASTMIDHALRWHGVRFALFLAWLAVGWWPIARHSRHRWDRAGARTHHDPAHVDRIGRRVPNGGHADRSAT